MRNIMSLTVSTSYWVLLSFQLHRASSVFNIIYMNPLAFWGTPPEGADSNHCIKALRTAYQHNNKVRNGPRGLRKHLTKRKKDYPFRREGIRDREGLMDHLSPYLEPFCLSCKYSRRNLSIFCSWEQLEAGGKQCALLIENDQVEWSGNRGQKT